MSEGTGQTPAGEGGGQQSEHPVSAPWAETQGVWNVGEGDAAKPWWDTLPDEAARQHVAAKQYANPGELALANYNLTRMQTGDTNVVNVPGKDATDEQWGEFYEKLGRPKTAGEYDLKFGEGIKTDDAMVEFGKNLFHEMGLSNDRAQKAADKWNEFVAAQEAQFLAEDKKRNDEALDALTSKWGPELEQNKAAGKRAVEALGLSADLISQIEQNIGSAPVVELLAAIGRKSDEGGFTSGAGKYDPNNPETMTKQQATARIAELQGDADFQKKYGDKAHPEHAEAVKLMERLFARG